ncbi:WXG100 family type VII secretion target [Nocardia sp. NPDC050697]|uniref:WXG100 family type VII secretion target n=1 Tax=Nocardia sp. NPDC050697 TaxID=3155158 RepID=UPI0033D9D530
MSVQSEHEVAEAAKTAMADAVTAIRATLNTITEDVEAAKRGWQGDANAAFVTAANDWEAEGTRLNRVLDELQEAVGSGTQQYRTMDSDNEAGFGGLRL